MTFEPTGIDDLVVITPKVFKDDRGYFFESFNLDKFTAHTGLAPNFIQDNQAGSVRGVLRGLHYQTGDAAQAKLVRAIEGEVLDVAVDLRPASPTFGKSFSVLLTAENQKQLFVPRGFAHGYLVLSDWAVFGYKVDNRYAPEREGGVRFDSPELNIDWPIDPSEIILSPKDEILPVFGQHQPAV